MALAVMNKSVFIGGKTKVARMCQLVNYWNLIVTANEKENGKTRLKNSEAKCIHTGIQPWAVFKNIFCIAAINL